MLSILRATRFAKPSMGTRMKHGSKATADLQVVFIRHGEKPNDTFIGLSQDGWNRAFRLPNVFLGSGSFLRNKTTAGVRIFAMQQKVESTDTMVGHSSRPIETVLPLADTLSLAVDSSYSKNKGDKLAKDILQSGNYSGKTVVICWEHKILGTEVIPAFGIKPAGAPANVFLWDGQGNPNNTKTFAFSKIVVFNFGPDGAIQMVQIRDQDDPSFVQTYTL